jgi:thiol-disulfide isomerase/thioredoxin
MLFFLSLRRALTGSNYETFVADTQRIPGYVMMYSPHCGHCRAVHPTWVELMEKFESEPRVIVADFDCVEHQAACAKFFPANGWPTFVLFVHGHGQRVDQERTLEGFSAVVRSLSLRNLSLPCLAHPYDRSDRYPAFVWASPPRAEARACASIQRIEALLPRARNSVYLDSADPPSLRALLSAHEGVDYAGRFDFASVLEFVREWTMAPLGRWSLEEGMLSSRRFAFFVSGSGWRERELRAAAAEAAANVLVGAIPLFEFAKRYPQFHIAATSLIAFSADKARFRIFTDLADPELFAGVLAELQLGAWDDVMQFPAGDLFSQQADGRKPRGRRRALLAVALLAGGAAAALSVLRWRAAKVE